MNKEARKRGRKTLQLYREYAPAVRELLKDAKISCRRGCSHCCYLLVYLTLPEALAIAERLLSSPERLKEVRRAIAAQLTTLTDPLITQHSYFRQQHPCIFLNNSECTIYDVRPTECRYYYVLSSPDLCGETGSLRGSVITKANMTKVKLRILTEMEAGQPAPMPVMLHWALRLLEDGQEAYEAEMREAQGVMKPSYWRGRFST